jgi:spermidine synthase
MQAAPPETAPGAAGEGSLPLLLPLFVVSGGCALIYEIVWFQLLELVIGSSAISLGVLLATFMGGMCIGSLGLPRFVPARHHPLRVYAALELGIGLLGLIVLFAIPLVGRLYTSSVGHGFGAVLLRAAICMICLLPPTILMGATLPAIARKVEATPRGMSWLGFFYGGNIAGAVLGSLLAGFYLLRHYDLATATFVAVALNMVVALIAMAIARHPSSGETPAESKSAADAPAERGRGAVYVAIALSGLCALGAEVVWTRLLSLMLGASVYTFSLILAVFLVALGAGSGIGSWIARSVRNPRTALAWCQLAQTATIAWAAAMIAYSLPYWPVNPSLAPNPWFTLQLDLTRCAWALFPAALLWGASFPLALASVATRGEDAGRLVGRVYAANTVGAISGAVLFSLVLIPTIGTQRSQQALIAASIVAAVVVLVWRTKTADRDDSWLGSPRRLAALAGAVVVATMLLMRIPEVPALLVAYGRYTVTWIDQVDVIYVGEGMNSSVAVTTLRSTGATQFHVSGKVEASSLPQDMRLQRMLGHLPALVHPNPKSVLVVGFGAGVTAGSFVPYPSVERIVVCEIEPLIPQVVATYFSKQNNAVLDDKRTQVFYDDARSFILTTDEKFDVITSDPIHPWVRGAASLYTREYFEAVKAHLKPGGVVSQWVTLYESTLDAVKSEIATFLEVFPHGTVWANNREGRGYDVVLLAQEGPTRIDVTAILDRLSNETGYPVALSLREVGFESLIDLFGTYAGAASDLRPLLADAEINTDRNLRLQYLAGVGLNRYEEGAIYDAIVQHRRFPEALFEAPEDWKLGLRQAIGGVR